MTSVRITRILLGAGLLAVTAGVAPAMADDYDYFAHRDTISSSVENANAANIATQTIDPWPPYAKDTNSHLDGRRAGLAITRYQQNRSIQPRGMNTLTGGERSDAGGGAALQK
jgi:hypothetical protein